MAQVPLSQMKMQKHSAEQLLTERFRCPEGIADYQSLPDLSTNSGCFRFARDGGYPGCRSGEVPGAFLTAKLGVDSKHLWVKVPTRFEPAHVINYLRLERYATKSTERQNGLLTKNALRSLYYLVRPFVPFAVRKRFQQIYFRGWDKILFPSWPVDHTVENIFEQLLLSAMKAREVKRLPFIWFWPDGFPSCAIMTHDVETAAGLNFCRKLMDLNDSFDIKASFQIIPEKRYKFSSRLMDEIRNRGFEINVHDLNHDGHLFSDYARFLGRVERIKRYRKAFEANGFRSAVLYRNVDWYHALDFSYDMSIPNVGHLDPQRGGCCTVLPFFIGNTVEIPVTTTQDYTLFHVLNDYSIQLWQEQTALIRAKHGVMNFIVHPDYLIPETARRVYVQLLSYLSDLRSRQEIWMALPNDVANWWRMRSRMNLVNDTGSWRVDGPGSERARVAYAVLSGDTIHFEVEQPSGPPVEQLALA
jgi:hypothetical protein